MFHDVLHIYIYIYIAAKIQHNFKPSFCQQYLKKPQDGGVNYKSKYFLYKIRGEGLLLSIFFLNERALALARVRVRHCAKCLKTVLHLILTSES